jgi:hypothetical protein
MRLGERWNDGRSEWPRSSGPEPDTRRSPTRVPERERGSQLRSALRIRLGAARRPRPVGRRITGFGLVLVLSIGLSIPVSLADHGSWHREQHSVDSSSFVQVTPHSQCGNVCTSLFADIYHSGAWVQTSCFQKQSCLGQTRSFSFPVTVQTRHSYLDGPHSVLNEPRSVYYA